MLNEAASQIIHISRDKSLNQEEKDERIAEVKKEIVRLGGLIKDWKDQKEWFEKHESKEGQFNEVDELLKKHKRPKR